MTSGLISRARRKPSSPSLASSTSYPEEVSTFLNAIWRFTLSSITRIISIVNIFLFLATLCVGFATTRPATRRSSICRATYRGPTESYRAECRLPSAFGRRRLLPRAEFDPDYRPLRGRSAQSQDYERGGRFCAIAPSHRRPHEEVQDEESSGR